MKTKNNEKILKQEKHVITMKICDEHWFHLFFLSQSSWVPFSIFFVIGAQKKLRGKNIEHKLYVCEQIHMGYT